MIGHHAGSQVVSLVEEHRFPGAPQERVVWRGAEPGGQRGKLFGGQEQPFDIPRRLLQLDATAVSALKDRVEIIRHDRVVCPPRDDPGKLARDGSANGESSIGQPVKGGDHRRHMLLRLRNVHARQSNALGAMRVRSQ